MRPPQGSSSFSRKKVRAPAIPTPENRARTHAMIVAKWRLASLAARSECRSVLGHGLRAWPSPESSEQDRGMFACAPGKPGRGERSRSPKPLEGTRLVFNPARPRVASSRKRVLRPLQRCNGRSVDSEQAGRVIEPRNSLIVVADALSEGGRQNSQRRNGLTSRHHRGRRARHVCKRVPQEPGRSLTFHCEDNGAGAV